MSLPTSTASSDNWVESAKTLINDFAAAHSLALSITERQVSAAFEIACLHSLLRFYEHQGYVLCLENLHNNEYRYLTTPSGNPANFSYVTLDGPDGKFEVRQQVRIQSHVDPEIRFTPDILVLTHQATVDEASDPDFAAGKRKLFSVKSDCVVAAHECKSMNPFPELMVSFIGMLVTAHKWYPRGKPVVRAEKGHLAPTLFVGGSARAFYNKMIAAMQSSYNLNIVVGMHAGTWSLREAVNRFTWGKVSARPVARKRARVGSAAAGLKAGALSKAGRPPLQAKPARRVKS